MRIKVCLPRSRVLLIVFAITVFSFALGYKVAEPFFPKPKDFLLIESVRWDRVRSGGVIPLEQQEYLPRCFMANGHPANCKHGL